MLYLPGICAVSFSRYAPLGSQLPSLLVSLDMTILRVTSDVLSAAIMLVLKQL